MKKTIVFILTAVLTLSVFTGCGNNEKVSTEQPFKKTTSDEYPLKTDETLTWWCALTEAAYEHSNSLNETPLAKGLIERTGVNIEFIHPTAGTDQFNLMIASGELPDIIEYEWVKYYPGGPGKAIKEGVIKSLNGIIEEVSPNLHKIFKENPDYEKQVRTEDGDLYIYPIMLNADKLQTYYGPMVRGDLLEKSGLEEPVTIADWDNMLRKFKEMGIDTPLTLKLNNKYSETSNAFMGAYGILGGFYVDNDVVKFGPYESAFGEYVKLMSGWYADGLLDRNFTEIDTKRVAALMADGECGAIFGSGGGDFGTFIPALTQNNPGTYMTPVQYPVLKEGDRPIGQKNWRIKALGASISGKCKNVELAARVLDYGYSEEGHMFYNFGIEGESYNMIDGYPTYTPEVIDFEKNGNMSIAGALSKYVRALYNGPFVQDGRYIEQYYTLDEQIKGLEIWSDNDVLKYKLPTLYMTNEESKECSEVMQDIDVFREEVVYKTIAGKMSIAEFNETYFNELKDRGIERAIEIYQAAYDRYKAQ